jgi:hypothetical protein
MTEPSDPVPSPVPSTDWILGTWQLLRCDAALELQPGTRMHFGTDQRLEYTIPTADGALRAELVWHLADGVLQTELEDGSNPLQVRATLEAADVLTFDFGGRLAWFVRAP